MMGVSVIIVNYRTPALTVSAARSALEQPEALEIIVVDNGSGDHSSSALHSQFDAEPRVTIVDSDRNVGFGRGNNIGVAAATHALVFLLNSDATFSSGCLASLVDAWGKLPRPGVLAPAVYRGDSEELQDDAIGPFPTSRRILTQRTKRYGTSLSPDWVSGCAMLLSREAFLAVGGFDPDFFMYFEDVLLCWRMRELGLTVDRHLDAGVHHLGGMSYGTSLRKKRDYYAAQDLLLCKMGEPSLGRALVKTVRWPYYVAANALGRF